MERLAAEEEEEDEVLPAPKWPKLGVEAVTGNAAVASATRSSMVGSRLSDGPIRAVA